jgi:hypothetical protein
MDDSKIEQTSNHSPHKVETPSNSPNNADGKHPPTLDHQHTRSNGSSAYWKTLQRDGKTEVWSNVPSLQSNDADADLLLSIKHHHGDVVTPITPYPDEYRSERQRLSQQFDLPASVSRNKKLDSAIVAARISTIVFFLRAFFLFQPYSQSLSNDVKNLNADFRFLTSLMLIVLVMVSLFRVFKSCKVKENITHRSSRWLSYSALVIMLAAEASLSVHLFIDPILQWLTPALFSLSNIVFILSTILNNKKCGYKIFFILCFAICTAGSMAVLLDTLGITIPKINPCTWSQTFVPIILIASIICAVLTTLESCIDKCIQKRSHQHHSNSNHAYDQRATLSTMQNDISQRTRHKGKDKHTFIIPGIYHDKDPIYVTRDNDDVEYDDNMEYEDEVVDSMFQKKHTTLIMTNENTNKYTK